MAYTRLMAQFFNADYERVEDVPVTDEQHAARLGAGEHYATFVTYKQSVDDTGPERRTGNPRDFSPRHHLGIDRLYTQDEAIAAGVADLNQRKQGIVEAFGDAAFQRSMAYVTEEAYKEDDPAKTRYARRPDTPAGEFITLGEGKKAFDSKGAQVWPLKP